MPTYIPLLLSKLHEFRRKVGRYLSNRILVFENNKLLSGQQTQKFIVLVETNYYLQSVYIDLITYWE